MVLGCSAVGAGNTTPCLLLAPMLKYHVACGVMLAANPLIEYVCCLNLLAGLSPQNIWHHRHSSLGLKALWSPSHASSTARHSKAQLSTAWGFCNMLEHLQDPQVGKQIRPCCADYHNIVLCSALPCYNSTQHRTGNSDPAV